MLTIKQDRVGLKLDSEDMLKAIEVKTSISQSDMVQHCHNFGKTFTLPLYIQGIY